MRPYRALVTALLRSSLREPVGLFFSVGFAPGLVVILGLVFGNDPKPEFGDRGYIDASLPAFASLVLAITGVMTLPVGHLQLRESGALRRLRATPLSARTWIAADLTQNSIVAMTGLVLALLVGVVAFGVDLPRSILGVVLACALGLCSFLALGYALAGVYPSATAAMGIGNPLMILLMITSGAFVPLAALPPGVQAVMRFSPIRHFVDLVKGQWAGEPWSDHWVPVAILLGMVLVLAPLGARLFRWSS
jgi:ABC-2 type transport system permease protein